MGDSAERFFLIVRAPNGEVREVPLGRVPIVIGRDESADIRVDDKKISRRHAAFKIIEGSPWVEDLGSSNGVRINGKLVERRAKLGYGDLVRVGRFYVSLKDSVENTSASVIDDERRDLGARPSGRVASDTARSGSDGLASGAQAMPVLEGLDEPVAGQVFVLHRGENVVGRLEECDIPILDGSVSRQHARLVFSRDRVTLSDLGSANGVFVNDVAVDMAELANGDEIRVGNVRFKLSLPAGLSTKQGPIETRAKVKKLGRKKRWGLFGSLILLIAAGVIGGAALWRVGRREVPEVREVSEVHESAPKQPRELATTYTATTPYAPRGIDGRPLYLPEVDETFDFDGFVAARLAVAQECETKNDYACLRSTLAELATRDPVNGIARAMQERVAHFEAASKALERANSLRAKGAFGRAFRVLVKVPSEMPQYADAQAQAQQLRKLAIEDELKLAKRDLKSRRTWKKAHARFRYVLELDPTSTDALKGLREAERKMRRRHVEFAPYQPEGVARGNETSTAVEAGSAILAHYEGDEQLAGIARAYNRGEVSKAIKMAKRLEARSRGVRARKARRLASALTKIDGHYERTRTEITNDAAQAWARLIQLQRIESKILPSGVESFVVRELEVSLGEAYAEQGASMFEQARFEEAFQRWEAGYKLDPTNPKVLAGLKKLEARAARYGEEAELAAQRGEKDVCERWKRITRMTSSESEVHKKARARVQQICRG